jgi:hypothetical protein
MSSNPSTRVVIAGRSWESHEAGLYCFEATLDGQPTEVHVSEDVAFDFLKAWTPDSAKCLEILRLHRADLARLLERKIRDRHRPGPNGFHVLTWRDTNAAAVEEEKRRAELELVPMNFATPPAFSHA